MDLVLTGLTKRTASVGPVSSLVQMAHVLIPISSVTERRIVQMERMSHDAVSKLMKFSLCYKLAEAIAKCQRGKQHLIHFDYFLKHIDISDILKLLL